MARRPIANTTRLLRPTLFDVLPAASSKCMFCRREDLTNEAAVEQFFVSRLIADLGYKNGQIRPKASIETFKISIGSKKQNYKPDYVLVPKTKPRLVIDAKGPTENLDLWTEQCASYCLMLNQMFDEDPVRYYVLSNGIETRLYEWNRGGAILTLDVDDFDWSNAKYQQFRALLAPAPLETGHAGIELQQFTFEKITGERARRLFVTCHDAIWKSEGFGPQAAFMEFVKVMFVKLKADKELREHEATKHLFVGAGKVVKLPERLVKFSVRWIEERTSDGIQNPVQTALFEQLRAEIETSIQKQHKKRIFDKDERIRLRPDTIKDVVRRLEHFDMFGIDEDLNGRLFETFLSATMRGRDLGQFFTPRSIVKTMTTIADLKATPDHQDTIIDACCGSGGFLIEALTMMRNQVRANAALTDLQKADLLETVANKCLFGIDFGQDPPLARLARINMYLHGDGGSRIYYADSLDISLQNIPSDDPEIAGNIQELRTDIEAGLLFDVALTNPPFAMAKEAKNDTERGILEQYRVAHRPGTAALRPSVRSSILFFERYHRILKPGGHLITVIDDTLLASKDFAYVRDFVRSCFIVKALISLPGDAFRRSGARVKTSFLVLEKKRSEDEQQPACFGYFAEHLGLDDLTPRAHQEEIDAARAVASQEMDTIVNQYRAFLAGKKVPLILQPDRIEDRLDLKFCAPTFGRMASSWRRQGVEVKTFQECVQVVTDEIRPADHPDTKFQLVKVSYDGVVEHEKVRLGRTIKPLSMTRVRKGQMIFSLIRATDGAIGIVPDNFDGALVSGSYIVFDAGSATDTAYLWAVLRSHELRADMQSLSPGANRYVTPWPEVGAVPVPWLPEQERHSIGEALLEAWRLEREVAENKARAMTRLDGLGVESESAIARWQASKAPT